MTLWSFPIQLQCYLHTRRGKNVGVAPFQVLTNGKLIGFFVFTSIVSSKSTSVDNIVHDVQALEHELIHLNVVEVESVVGNMPSMSKGQHSHHAHLIAHSSSGSKMFVKGIISHVSTKPTPLSAS